MDAYFRAKLRLFSEVVDADGAAVVWTDDGKSDEVARAARRRGARLLTVGSKGDEIRLAGWGSTKFGQLLTVQADGRRHRIELPLIGAYQAANALVAAGLVIATGGDAGETLANLGRVTPVRGRMERAAITRAGAPVYIDYAHTPDALAAAIGALRAHTAGRVVLVFGAGGDRDVGKRGQMGEVAARLADVVIVTDDNPRTEEPGAIRAAVLAGAGKAEGGGAREIGDRREAIANAVRLAETEDIVLVAGKGHETGQVVGGLTLPFDDVAVAREVAR